MEEQKTFTLKTVSIESSSIEKPATVCYTNVSWNSYNFIGDIKNKKSYESGINYTQF